VLSLLEPPARVALQVGIQAEVIDNPDLVRLLAEGKRGIISGLIFGVLSLLRATNPFFKDPTVAILPRLFIGLTAWATFAALRRINRDLAAAAAGFVGSATNTILVVGAIILRGYLPAKVVIPLVLVQSIFEAVIAAILIVILARVFYIIEGRVMRAPDTKPRSELPY